jgi:ADP-heptose:LPS heptosyltransferase
LKPFGYNTKLLPEELILVEHKPEKGAVGVYAAAMKNENRLPLSQWKTIIESHGSEKHFYFFGGKEDKEHYDNLKSQLPGFDIIRCDGELSLKNSLLQLAKMSFMFSEDGGVYHMAICAGVPVESFWLHGESNMKKWKSPFWHDSMIFYEQ